MNNNITEDYCSFDVSKLLARVGFLFPGNGTNYSDEWFEKGYMCYAKHHKKEVPELVSLYYLETNHGACKYNWIGYPVAPSHSHALKWIRENFPIHINITFDLHTYDVEIFNYGKDEVIKLTSSLSSLTPYCFTTYEEAVEAALLYTLTNLIPNPSNTKQ